MHIVKMNNTSTSLKGRNQFKYNMMQMELLDSDKQVINVLKSPFHQCFKVRNILLALLTSWTENTLFYDTYCCMQNNN